MATPPFDTAPARPWYRQVWPWLLMLPPASTVIFWAVIVFTMAGPPSLVSDDVSRAGLTYAADRSDDPAATGPRMNARLHANRDSGHISLVVKPDSPAEGPLEVTLIHPLEASSDRIVELKRDAAGVYHGDLGAPLRGRRDIRLVPAAGDWRLTGRLAADSDLLELEATDTAP